MKKLADIAFWLVIIGGLVVGYEGLTNRDLIRLLISNPTLEALVQGSIGVAALIVLGGKLKR